MVVWAKHRPPSFRCEVSQSKRRRVGSGPAAAKSLSHSTENSPTALSVLPKSAYSTNFESHPTLRNKDALCRQPLEALSSDNDVLIAWNVDPYEI